MQIEFPKVEYILNNKQEKLTDEQKLWLQLVCLRESILNMAIKNFMGLEKDNCQTMYLSTFLNSLYDSIKDYCQGECLNKLLFDDFVYIASVASKSVKAIVASPSTKLIKVDEYAKYNKVKNTGIKTMQWLAKRPGSTVTEKISPQNKVLTVSTKFSVDTKENEACMYLYDTLYKILSNRLFNCDCYSCKRSDCEHKKVYDEMLKLYALHTSIRKSELGSIPKVRPSTQNNKLMCDKYYKVIWDCNVKTHRMEKELHNEWKNLYELLKKDLFFYVLAITYMNKEYQIQDVLGKLSFDANGALQFLNREGEEVLTVSFLKESQMCKKVFTYQDSKIYELDKYYRVKKARCVSDEEWDQIYDLYSLSSVIDSYIASQLQEKVTEEETSVIVQEEITDGGEDETSSKKDGAGVQDNG